MQFSRAQLKTLSEARLRDFEERCVALLRTTWRDDFAHLDDEVVREVVRERRERAARYGFTGQRDVYRFLNLSCYLGLDFERRPENGWVVDILHDPAVDLGQKVEMIVRRCEEDRRRG
jgi:hypothetical protein